MIYQLFIISSLTVLALCQQQYSNQLTTTPRPAPPAQVHYVNIGADLAGDYKFGYDTGASDRGQSFREETRSADGTVRGAYGYTDAGGQQRIVKYSAGKEGFKIEDDSPAQSSGNRQRQAAPTAAPYRPPQTLPPQVYRPAPAQQPQSYRPQQPAPQSNYIELQARPIPQNQYRTPSQTLRQTLPSSYSSPSLSTNVGQFSNAALSSSSRPASYDSDNSGTSYQPSQPSYQSYPPSQPSLQTYRPASQPSYQSAPAQPSQPALRTYNFATTARPEEETWGPPVINTALLSYNIGSQGSQPASRLRYASSSSSESYQAPSPPPAASVSSFNTPVLRTYSGLSNVRQERPEEKWGPPVINTALLAYNIGTHSG